MTKLPKWTERSDIKWRPVSEKPANTGRILLAVNAGNHFIRYNVTVDAPWETNIKGVYDLWAWVCWNKT